MLVPPHKPRQGSDPAVLTQPQPHPQCHPTAATLAVLGQPVKTSFIKVQYWSVCCFNTVTKLKRAGRGYSSVVAHA